MTKLEKDKIKESISELKDTKKRLCTLTKISNEYCSIVNGDKPRQLNEQELDDFNKIDQERLKVWREVTILEYALSTLDVTLYDLVERVDVNNELYAKVERETFISVSHIKRKLEEAYNKIQNLIKDF